MTPDDRTSTDTFAIDIDAIKTRARAHIANGAVTPDYRGNRQTIVKLLNEALATELVCVLRYKRHYFMSGPLGGIAGYAVRDELLAHANEEQVHADRIAERIVQLGGTPNFNPEGLASRSHAAYVEGDSLSTMLKEDEVAERIAIEVYSEMIRYVGASDPTTRRLLEDILAQEEKHADELADFLKTVEQLR